MTDNDKQSLDIDAEYRELNNHIRECWKYISDLLRNFLFLQIILVSVIFLGGSVAKIEGINVGINTGRDSTIQSGNPSTNNRLENSDNGKFRKQAILPLLLIGLFGSIGAAVQNHRLFINATYFIHRAAYLEHRGGLVKDTRTSTPERTLPANTYMRENLYPGKKLNLKVLLLWTYGGFGLLWMYFTFDFARNGFSF
jgi:hypothetical protein